MATPTRLTFVKNEPADDLSFVLTCVPDAADGFPKTRLYDNDPQAVFKAATAQAAHAIKYDFGSDPQAFNAAALVNHNVPSTGFNIKLQANATDSWAAPSINTAFTWRDKNMHVFVSNSTAYRFWRILIQTTAGFIVDVDGGGFPGAGIVGTTVIGGAGDGAPFQLTLGELVLGAAVESPLNPVFSTPEGWVWPTIKNQFSFGGDVRYAYARARVMRFRWADSILNDTNLGTFYGLWVNRRGAGKPLLAVLDPSTLSAWYEGTNSYFGRFSERFNPVRDFVNQNMVELDFEEISSGRLTT